MTDSTPVRGLDAWRDILDRLLPGNTRVFLATLGFGDGHNRAAGALERILGALRPDTVTRLRDPLSDHGPPVWRRRRERYYGFIVSHPRLYHRAYRALSRTPWVLAPALTSLCGWFAREVDEFRADVVVSTHVFFGWASARVARGGRAHRSWGLITDLVDDAYWNRTRLDQYLVATDVLRAKLIRAGTSPDRISVSGLPVDPLFLERHSGESARRSLGLRPDRLTVLLLGGGAGFGPLHGTAALLAESDLPVQVIAVAGRNQDLRERLEQLTPRARVPLRVVGYTDRIDVLMDASDLAVTKPGGMTAAECLAKGLPMILYGNPLPGPETLNEAYLLGSGLAQKARDPSELLSRECRSRRPWEQPMRPSEPVIPCAQKETVPCEGALAVVFVS